LFAIELPITSAVQARDASPPDAPLLLRVVDAAKLLGVSRSAMYELVASGQVPVAGSDARSGCCAGPRRHGPGGFRGGHY